MSNYKMGQTNNCLTYKTGSYNVEQTMLARQGCVSRCRRRDTKYGSRRVLSVPEPVREENGAILNRVVSRRISDPIAASIVSRRSSLDQLASSCSPLPHRRRQSVQVTREERSHHSSRRKSLPFDSKRSFRLIRGLKSLYGRVQQSENDDASASPSRTPRKRSSSLGHVIVAMAHNRLRNSESAQSSPRTHRESERKTVEEQTDTPPAQEEEVNELQQPASVESLVRRCASCFDEDGDCTGDDFPRVLFLTHVWFMTPEQLLVLFSQLYEDENTPEETKKKVFFAIRFWMKEFAHMFDLDQPLLAALKDLQEKAANDDLVDCSIIDVTNRGNFRWMRKENLSIRPPQAAGRKRRKVSLVFHHLQPEELAIHMSYLEFKCFKRLTFEDFHKYAVHGTIKDNAKLERSVFLFNNITYWVQCMVLGQHTPQERAAIITKYIKIAQKLREMRNYNTLMAIVGGLTHTAISRLKKTMSSLTKDTIKALEELVDLMDSRSNYVAYRRDYAQKNDTFKIPIIGILMKDIIGLQAALPDRVGDGLINVKKMLAIGATFQEITSLQRIPFPYDVNKDLMNTLRVSLYLYYTEEEIYALSLKREPRDTKYSTSSAGSPSKVNSMVFAEFTKFTCQLDRDTVKQHVTAMVESVFKAYDHDNDGFISEEEFQNFTDNFPMMESFSAMDVDRDGRISRSEMCQYFLKASAVQRNDFCQSFTHEFVETSYFHPTFCQECEKLLWGLVKQGWKCKSCGINCHKHCKDRIVQECRPKQTASQSGSVNGQNRNGNTGKRNGTREKSVSSESDISANGDAITAVVNTHGNPSISTLEDEAFDSPGELSNIQSYPVSPSAMRRATSFASADVTSRKMHLQASRTPPPTRKASSPDVGRRSLMKKIMPKRHNSTKVRAVSDATTQTPTHSPPSGTPVHEEFRAAPARSFLYPLTAGSNYMPVVDRPTRTGQLPNGRLGSTGEDIDSSSELPLSNLNHANNNHIIVQTASQEVQLAGHLQDLELRGRGDGPRKGIKAIPVEPLSIKNDIASPFSHCGDLTPTPHQHLVITRRDSGLSGCSAFTVTSENSFPVTPVLLSEFPPSQTPTAKTFQFPSSFYDEIAAVHSLSIDDKARDVPSLREENQRLRETNVVLQSKLNAANEYTLQLKSKLKELGIQIPSCHEMASESQLKI